MATCNKTVIQISEEDISKYSAHLYICLLVFVLLYQLSSCHDTFQRRVKSLRGKNNSNAYSTCFFFIRMSFCVSITEAEMLICNIKLSLSTMTYTNINFLSKSNSLIGLVSRSWP